MSSLELTAFKKIFETLSLDYQKDFIKEIEESIYNKLFIQAVEGGLLDNIKDVKPIISLLKKDNFLLQSITGKAVREILKYGLIYKTLNENILKNCQMRKFKYQSNIDKMYILISKTTDISEEFLNSEYMTFIEDWMPYSIDTIATLNILLPEWKFYEDEPIVTIEFLFQKLGININNL